MIEQILIEHELYKNEVRLFLKFPYDNEVIKLVKNLPQVRWSNTKKAWHILYQKDLVIGVINLFALKGIKVNYINQTAPVPSTIDSAVTGVKPVAELKNLSPETISKIEGFRKWMHSRRYSESTIGTYSNALKTFLRYFSRKQISEITNDDIVLFNNEYILKNKFSASFQNQVVNAIKLFFKISENKVLELDLIHRPKRAFVLPNVLSKEEIKSLLGAHNNLKHKTMLSLIYSCGLRRSELLNLKISDIDSKRGLIIIKQAKGKKDRIAPLSGKMLELLRAYFVACKPKEWLFEGQNGIGQYDEEVGQRFKTGAGKKQNKQTGYFALVET